MDAPARRRAVTVQQRLVAGRSRRVLAACVTGALAVGLAGAASGQAAGPRATAAQADRPWMDTSLSPDRRADLLLAQMRPEEKGELMSNDPGTTFAYFNAPIERLGIPPLKMFDAGSGIRV